MIIKNEEKKERKKEKSVIGAKKSFFGECESVKRIEKKKVLKKKRFTSQGV